MTVRRDGFGRMKRDEGTRSIRRAHLQGAYNMVLKGDKGVGDFTGRVRKFLERFFK